jgi:hypothetical protein
MRTTGSTYLATTSGQKVGIGTINPSATLDVNGTINLLNTLTIKNSTDNTSVLTLSQGGVDTTIQNSNPEGTIFIKTKDATGSLKDTLSISSVSGVGVVLGTNLNMNSNLIDQVSEINWTDGSVQTTAGQWSNGSSNAIYYNSGNVGIGTTTPAYTLDVSGNLGTTMDASINSITVGRGGGNISTNTTLGFEALKINTSGEQNIAIGFEALQSNIDGQQSTAIGYNALKVNRSGYNTAVGSYTLSLNTIGRQNTAIGGSALLNNTDGSYNTAIGYNAGQNLSGNSSYNTFLGFGANVPNSSLYTNSTALGYQATIDASNQIVLGGLPVGGSYPSVKIPGSYLGIGGVYNPSQGLALDVKGTIRAGNNSGNNNFVNLGGGAAVGEKALWVDYYIDSNPLIPEYGIIQVEDQGNSWKNLSLNPYGGNVGIGTTTPAYRLDVSGNGNFTGLITALSPSYPDDTTKVPTTSWVNAAISGSSTASKWTTEPTTTNIYYNSGNVGIGTTSPQSVLDVSGNLNVSQDATINSITVGLGGGKVSSNTAIGYVALRDNIDGTYNTVLGLTTLTLNKHGSNNTAIGTAALYYNIDGSNNTAIGLQALFNNIVGYNNTAVGVSAGSSDISGNNNTFLGFGSNIINNTFTYRNSTALGYNALIDASNQIVLGGGDGSGAATYPGVKIPGTYVGIGGVYNPLSGCALDVNGKIQFSSCLKPTYLGTLPSNNPEFIGGSSETTLPLYTPSGGVTSAKIGEFTPSNGVWNINVSTDFLFSAVSSSWYRVCLNTSQNTISGAAIQDNVAVTNGNTYSILSYVIQADGVTKWYINSQWSGSLTSISIIVTQTRIA